MDRMLLPLLVFSCVMCLCTTNRIKRLENRVARIERTTALREDLVDIDETLADLNTSLAECLGTAQYPATPQDKAVHDESLSRDVGTLKLALADEKARWRREAAAMDTAIVVNKQDIGAVKSGVNNCFENTVSEVTAKTKPLETSLSGVKQDIGFIESSIASVTNNVANMEKDMKSSMKELKLYVDNSVKEIRDDILQALRDTMSGCCQTSTPRPTTTPYITEPTTTSTSPVHLQSCLELHRNGERQSGVYTIYPLPSNKPVQVYCDMDTDGGGWAVFQRRQDGSVNFYRTWADYASGFGNVSGEFWLGNDLISLLTSRGPHELRIDMKDFANDSAFAKYGTFKVSPSATKYRLEVGGFSGDAGDSLGRHSGLAFSTRDRDNDGSWRNCAEYCRGAWWYDYCGFSNLNGRYGQGHGYRGVWWLYWKGNYDPLMWTEMKLRATPQA